MDEAIRRKAEALLRENYPVEDLAKDKDLPQILHELRVHQVELELQNDELRRTQIQLRATQEKYFNLYNLAPVGYFTLDQKGVILDLNLAGAEMLGQTRDYLVNKPLLVHLMAESRPLFFEFLDDLFKSHIRQTCELTFHSPHQALQQKPIAVQVEGEVDQTELYCRLIVTDVTRLKAAEQAIDQERALLAQRVAERTAELRRTNMELQRAFRLKSEFLAAMSHELRTPLHTILGHSEILDEQIYGVLNNKQLKSVEVIQKSSKHLLNLINDVLDLSKIETDDLKLIYSRVDLLPLCQASLDFVRQAAQDKEIQMTADIDLANTIIEADELRLKQILINLLSNAVKFTPAQGTVEFSVRDRLPANMIEFMVHDTGIGIAQENLEQMFQPFVQLDGRLNRQEVVGTGLGLTLVQRLTAMHNGHIEVESEVGRGSRFTIRLPRHTTQH